MRIVDWDRALGKRGRGAVVCGIALGSVVAFGGCGGGDGDRVTPPPPTAAPAPVRSLISQGSFELSAPTEDTSYFYRFGINTTVPGSLETTVDWTSPENEVWMYIAEGACTLEQFANPDCPGETCACRFSVVSEVRAPKPRVLTLANASPGTRALFIWNLGPREESGSYQSVLTTQGVASAAAAPRETIAATAAKRRPRRP